MGSPRVATPTNDIGGWVNQMYFPLGFVLRRMAPPQSWLVLLVVPIGGRRASCMGVVFEGGHVGVGGGGGGAERENRGGIPSLLLDSVVYNCIQLVELQNFSFLE